MAAMHQAAKSSPAGTLMPTSRPNERASIRRKMAIRKSPARSPSSSAPLLPATGVTTTDLLKVIGVATFLVDHYGFFFHTDELWWRMFGRVASPIFFFLVGFARTREVPLTWLAFGLAL